MMQQLRAERVVFEKCAATPEYCPSDVALIWLAELDRSRGLGPLERIAAINTAANRRTYMSDDRNFHVVDYWASPLQFLKGSGDCEEFVFLKYLSLRLIGFAARDLRIVLVRDTINNADHAVLAVYLNDEIYILDNNSKTVESHTRLSQYVPLLSFDTTSSWGHIPRRTNLAGTVETASQRFAGAHGPTAAHAHRVAPRPGRLSIKSESWIKSQSRKVF